MYVEVLTVSQKSHDRHWSEMTPEPIWPDIAQAIEDLDGDERPLLTLGSEDGLMTIGGADDRFLVTATLDCRQYHSAVDPAQPGDVIPLPLAGKVRACPARVLISRSSAMRAARTFALEGRLEPSLAWEAC